MSARPDAARPAAVPSPAPTDELAFLLDGGGARGAYQVGVLRWIARHYPTLRVPILTGVSAGAVNTAHLASHHGTFRQSVAELTGLWQQLTLENVFRLSAPTLAWNVTRWGARLVSGGLLRGSRSGTRAFLDASPLREYLEEAFACVNGDITGIDYNLRREALRAVAISTTNYSTGQAVVWVQGKGVRPWRRPGRHAVHTDRLTVDHVMASCAIPLFFPAVKIGRSWYGDGGLRLAAPLSPALHLGAQRILAISTRYEAPGSGRRKKTVIGYPSPAVVFGTMLNAIFLDLIDQDAERLKRFNELLSKVPPAEREGMRIIDFVSIRPSRDIGRLARKYEPQLPRAFRFLSRGLGTRESASPDLLSMLLFIPEYMNRLMEVGEADAERHAEELTRLLESRASSAAGS